MGKDLLFTGDKILCGPIFNKNIQCAQGFYCILLICIFVVFFFVPVMLDCIIAAPPIGYIPFGDTFPWTYFPIAMF